jgi:hypothetical protein
MSEDPERKALKKATEKWNNKKMCNKCVFVYDYRISVEAGEI